MICHEKNNSLPYSIKTPFVKSKIKKKSKENSVAKMSTQFCEIRHQENRG